MHDDDSSPGYHPDDEPTLVPGPRITRPQVSKGVRILASSFGELRKSLYEFVEVFDEATRLGAMAMSEGEALEIDDFLADAVRRVKGVRRALRRATGPQGTDGTVIQTKENR
jgi:hypothetical protein